MRPNFATKTLNWDCPRAAATNCEFKQKSIFLFCLPVFSPVRLSVRTVNTLQLREELRASVYTSVSRLSRDKSGPDRL